MKKRLSTIALVLFVCMNTFSQATSLTIDNQTPGWLSSKINYGDQQTLENLKLTGYINGSDILFIRELNSNRNLSGVIDLRDVSIVSGGSSYGNFKSIGDFDVERYTSDNTISDYMFANLKPIRKIILPLTTTFFGSRTFLLTVVDTLIINGSMEDVTIGDGSDMRFWKTRCIYFPEGVKKIQLSYYFHPSAGLDNIELFFPSTLEEIHAKNILDKESTTIHCSSINPEKILNNNQTNVMVNTPRIFGVGKIIVPNGTKEKYEESIFSLLTIIEKDETAGLSFSEDTVKTKYGRTGFEPQLFNPTNLTVTFTSANSEVATVEPTTGKVTLVNGGTTSIYATTISDGYYGKVSYTLIYDDSAKIYDLNNDGKISTADIQVIINEMKK